MGPTPQIIGLRDGLVALGYHEDKDFFLGIRFTRTEPAQGALASYGPSSYQTGRQAARLVGKITKGTNPAEIPVEVNAEIEFVLNLKTAKTLGITFPPTILYQAP